MRTMSLTVEQQRDLEEVSSRVYPDLERAPGKADNWVEKAGGLPDYIERIAKHLHYEKGKAIGHSIAIAVNQVKRWCSGGTVSSTKGPTKSQNVSAATKAKACKAVAEWNAKRAKSKAGSVKEARKIKEDAAWLEEHAVLTDPEAQELLAIFTQRLIIVESLHRTLHEGRSAGKAGIVKAARELVEAQATPKRLPQIGGPAADPREQSAAAKALKAESGELRLMIDVLGGEIEEAAVDAPEDATKRVEKAASRSPRERRSNGDGAPEAIQKGESGTPVQQAQARLGELGYDTPKTGNFDGETDQAVKSFQGDHDLKQDGVVGPKTKIALRGTTPEIVQDRRAGASEPDPEASTTVDTNGDGPGKPTFLAKGMGVGEEEGNPEVADMQSTLNGMGAFVGDAGADGRFGPETEKGLKRVQRRFGLKADGIVGPKTGNLLERNKGTAEDTEPDKAGAAKPAKADGKPKKADKEPDTDKDKSRGKIEEAARPKQRGGDKAVDDPEFEKKHPRAPEGRVSGGKFIQAGSSGDLVGAVQKLLPTQKGKPDGEFGDATAQAVRRYQRQNDLLVDGIVGSQTASALLGDKADPGALTGDLRKGLRKKKPKGLQEASLVGRGGEALRDAFSVVDKLGNALRRLPGGKWQTRNRAGRWISMPNPPDPDRLQGPAKAKAAADKAIAARNPQQLDDRTRERGILPTRPQRGILPTRPLQPGDIGTPSRGLRIERSGQADIDDALRKAKTSGRGDPDLASRLARQAALGDDGQPSPEVDAEVADIDRALDDRIADPQASPSIKPGAKPFPGMGRYVVLQDDGRGSKHAVQGTKSPEAAQRAAGKYPGQTVVVDQENPDYSKMKGALVRTGYGTNTLTVDDALIGAMGGTQASPNRVVERTPRMTADPDSHLERVRKKYPPNQASPDLPGLPVGKVTVDKKSRVGFAEATPEKVQRSIRQARKRYEANPEARDTNIREMLGRVSDERHLTPTEKRQYRNAGGKLGEDGFPIVDQASPGVTPEGVQYETPQRITGAEAEGFDRLTVQKVSGRYFAQGEANFSQYEGRGDTPEAAITDARTKAGQASPGQRIGWSTGEGERTPIMHTGDFSADDMPIGDFDSFSGEEFHGPFKRDLVELTAEQQQEFNSGGAAWQLYDAEGKPVGYPISGDGDAESIEREWNDAWERESRGQASPEIGPGSIVYVREIEGSPYAQPHMVVGEPSETPDGKPALRVKPVRGPGRERIYRVPMTRVQGGGQQSPALQGKIRSTQGRLLEDRAGGGKGVLGNELGVDADLLAQMDRDGHIVGVQVFGQNYPDGTPVPPGGGKRYRPVGLKDFVQQSASEKMHGSYPSETLRNMAKAVPDSDVGAQASPELSDISEFGPDDSRGYEAMRQYVNDEIGLDPDGPFSLMMPNGTEVSHGGDPYMMMHGLTVEFPNGEYVSTHENRADYRDEAARLTSYGALNFDDEGNLKAGTPNIAQRAEILQALDEVDPANQSELTVARLDELRAALNADGGIDGTTNDPGAFGDYDDPGPKGNFGRLIDELEDTIRERDGYLGGGSVEEYLAEALRTGRSGGQASPPDRQDSPTLEDRIDIPQGARARVTDKDGTDVEGVVVGAGSNTLVTLQTDDGTVKHLGFPKRAEILDASQASPDLGPTNPAFKPGAEVEGDYYGEPFQGKVKHMRPNTMDPSKWEIHVELDEPIEVYGSERRGIGLGYTDDSGVGPPDSQGTITKRVRLREQKPDLVQTPSGAIPKGTPGLTTPIKGPEQASPDLDSARNRLDRAVVGDSFDIGDTRVVKSQNGIAFYNKEGDLEAEGMDASVAERTLRELDLPPKDQGSPELVDPEVSALMSKVPAGGYGAVDEDAGDALMALRNLPDEQLQKGVAGESTPTLARVYLTAEDANFHALNEKIEPELAKRGHDYGDYGALSGFPAPGQASPGLAFREPDIGDRVRQSEVLGDWEEPKQGVVLGGGRVGEDVPVAWDDGMITDYSIDQLIVTRPSQVVGQASPNLDVPRPHVRAGALLHEDDDENTVVEVLQGPQGRRDGKMLVEYDGGETLAVDPVGWTPLPGQASPGLDSDDPAVRAAAEEEILTRGGGGEGIGLSPSAGTGLGEPLPEDQRYQLSPAISEAPAWAQGALRDADDMLDEGGDVDEVEAILDDVRMDGFDDLVRARGGSVADVEARRALVAADAIRLKKRHPEVADDKERWDRRAELVGTEGKHAPGDYAFTREGWDKHFDAARQEYGEAVDENIEAGTDLGSGAASPGLTTGDLTDDLTSSRRRKARKQAVAARLKRKRKNALDVTNTRMAQRLANSGGIETPGGTKISRREGGWEVKRGQASNRLGGTAAQALDAAKALEDAPQDVQGELKAAWLDSARRDGSARQKAADRVEELTGLRPGGQASPAIVPDSFDENTSGTEMQDLEIGDQFALKGGKTYVLHKWGAGSQFALVKQTTGPNGSIMPKSDKGEKVDKLFHRYPPGSIGPKHPEYGGEVAAPDVPEPVAAQTAAPVDSPARSAKGNLRNFKAMKDDKLTGLASDMEGVDDPEAVQAINVELAKRGYGPPEPGGVVPDAPPTPETPKPKKKATKKPEKVETDSPLFDTLKASVEAAQKGDLPSQADVEPSTPEPPKPKATPAPSDAAPNSPARSGKGNIRNLQAMGDEKLQNLGYEMEGHYDTDPEAWDAVNQALKERDLAEIPQPEQDIGEPPLAPDEEKLYSPDAPDAPETPVDPGLGEMAPGDVETLPNNTKIIKTADAYMVQPGDGETPSLHNDSQAAMAAAEAADDKIALQAEGVESTLAQTAEKLGPEWTPGAVEGALAQLAEQGIELDPMVEQPETLQAVIDAANLQAEQLSAASAAATPGA